MHNRDTQGIATTFFLRYLGITMVMLLSLNISAWALGSAGLGNGVLGAKALGQGNAFAAQADDPSAIAFNPAGITQVEGTWVSIGGTIEAPRTTYTNPGGVETKSNIQTPLVPNLYFTHHFDDKPIAYGVGFTSPYGLQTKWGTDTFSRYVATLSKFNMFMANPTLAFSVNDKTSVGIGLDVIDLFNVDLQKQVNVGAVNTVLGAPSAAPDGSARLQAGGTGVGFNFGVLYKPHPMHSFGLAYRSPIKTDVEGYQELHGLSGASAAAFGGSDFRTAAEGKFTFPQNATLAYSFQPTDRFRWNADVEWTEWSVFNKLDVSFPQANALQKALLVQDPPSIQWTDSFSVGTGASYQFTKIITGRIGYIFQQSPIPDSTFSTNLPDGGRHEATIGGSFSFERFGIDWAYDAVFENTRTITNTVGSTSGSSINGEYETFVNVFAANVNWKF